MCSIVWPDIVVMEDEMGRVCNSLEIVEKCMQNCLWKSSRKETALKTLACKLILKQIVE